MGEAKRRGSFEQRKAEAEKRKPTFFQAPKARTGKKKSTLGLLAAIFGMGGLK